MMNTRLIWASVLGLALYVGIGLTSVINALVMGNNGAQVFGVVQAAPKAKQIDFWNDSEPASQLRIDHSGWSDMLKKYVGTNHASGVNRFDYDAVTPQDKQALEAYIAMVQSMDPRQMAIDHQKAYWLNLFNAALVLEVLNSEPDYSIKDISSRKLWRGKRFYISMQKMSLDDVEHGVIRPMFKDPRVHFAMVGGAVGSADLLTEAFSGENVDGLLDQNTRAFLSHPRGVKFEGKTLVLSSIFKWYKSDFGANLTEIKAFIKPYLPSQSAALMDAATKVKYDYDWALNKP